MRFYIIGYMASGKTTFGKALAEKTGLKFIDLDNYIEETAGKPITEIFAERGEEGFREIERTLLREASEENADFIMACGGGTPCHFDNMEYINDKGISIFLETSTPVLINRLQIENEKRPLVAGKTDEEIKEKVLSQLCERLPHYLDAKLKWSGDELETAEEITSNVEHFINSYPSLFR